MIIDIDLSSSEDEDEAPAAHAAAAEPGAVASSPAPAPAPAEVAESVPAALPAAPAAAALGALWSDPVSAAQRSRADPVAAERAAALAAGVPSSCVDAAAQVAAKWTPAPASPHSCMDTSGMPPPDHAGAAPRTANEAEGLRVVTAAAMRAAAAHAAPPCLLYTSPSPRD